MHLPPRRPLYLACRALFAAGVAATHGLTGTALAADAAPATPGSGEIAPDHDPGLKLKLQRNFLLKWRQSKEEHPGFLIADRVEGGVEGETIAEGNAELRRALQVIDADWMKYTADDDTLFAHGNVKVTRENGDEMTGPELKLRLDTHTGYFESPDYRLGKYVAHGKADRIDFKGDDHYLLHGATFSTCPASKEAWVLMARDLELDYTRDVGTAHGMRVYFYDIPILAAAWADFSLSNNRKTGFLAPSFGTTGKSGFEANIPFYWNIAPNMDATIAPRLLQKRGVQFNNEFRYLEPNFRGEAHVEYLPNDLIKGTDRYGLSLLHTQQFGNGFSGALNLNKVSDDTYFTDLSTHIAMTSQANLLRDATLFYGAGWWNGLIRMQTFQTLQDPLAPIVPPYRRTPQILASGSRPTPYGDFSFLTEFVDFGHPTLQSGDRFTLYPSISFPYTTTAGYVTPKIGVHYTEYDLRPVPGNLNSPENAFAVVVPVMSLDSGLTFERDIQVRGQNMTQTLEPRLYYLFVPYRNQSLSPNFDSAIADLNLAQLFSENSYVGGDRFSDANQLTAAVSTRLIRSDNGQELIRATFGERFYFEQQRVTLDAVTPPRTARNADVVAAVTGHITNKLSLDTSIQYDPAEGRTERTGVTLRYLPELGKVINLGYQYSRDLLQQVDISAQWPVGGNISLVGRYNYSIQDGRLLEGLGGVEYNGGCWVARFVVQRYALATESSSSAVFVQLELNGLSRIGSNPLEALKRNIPGYSRINQPITTSPGFSLVE
jgi:LPS-assembly protein